ncbi:MAG: replicative DNA helicase [Chloroflexi bacterium]|nr:replicative DNA helicase [Chloroflexota bacterium]
MDSGFGEAILPGKERVAAGRPDESGAQGRSEPLPPHDIEAEEAVIGSLIIDGEAIFRIAPFLKPEDFFREQNQWCYQACLALYQRNEPINQVTLAHELAGQKRLDEAGGLAYLSTVAAQVPTSLHIEQYARIVHRTATLRGLIAAAGRIARLGYEGGPDVDEALGRAEEILFRLRRPESSERGFVHIRDVLDHYLAETALATADVLQRRRSHLPTGFKDVDKVLGGFHPSDLIILAARPGLGKSALALNIARHVALDHGATVAFFSLEMAKEQLAQRLLAGESGIDGQRLRMGTFNDTEERAIMEANGILSEAPIYVDDTPLVSVVEMRSKARRLHSERPNGIGLLIVDYLQLMRADGHRDNRVQEIGEISRSLKGVARELDVPVLAVSQLSRAVEARTDRVPQLSDLRESGCLSGDTLVTLADHGARVPMRDLVGKSGFRVWALNDLTLRIEAATVSRAFGTGRNNIYRLITRLGRTICATGNHEFRTFAAWQRLDTLGVGNRIALPRRMGSGPSKLLSSGEAALLGHLVGDGWRSLGMAYMGTGLYKQNVSRERTARLALAVGGDVRIAALASSDVYWDEIISVEPAGEEDVYDLTVPGPANFIANDIVVHNSIEQDADVVMFIHREDAYQREEDWKRNHPLEPFPKGIARIIVAKHRNGPVGSLKLYFRDHLAKFENLAAAREEDF